METQVPKSKRNVYILGFVSLFTDISSQMINPLIPQFLVNLGATTSLIGIIEGIAESTASLFKTYFGKFSDRLGNRKKFIFFGYSLSALSKPFLFLSTLWSHVLFIKFLERMGKAMRSPARDALIAASVSKEKRGAAFGFHRGMDRAGALIGPVVALVILQFAHQDIRTVFLFAGIPALIAVLFIPLAREAKQFISPISKHNEVSSIKNRPFKIFLIGNVVFTLGNSSNAFLLLKASEVGIEITTIPLLWMAYNLMAMLASPIFGKLSDKVGKEIIISISFIFYSVIYFAFSIADQAYIVWGLFMAYGIYYGLSSGVYKAYIGGLIENKNRAGAYGVFEAAIGLALLPASLIMGYIWELFGSNLAFIVSSIFSIIGFFIVLFSFRKQ